MLRGAAGKQDRLPHGLVVPVVATVSWHARGMPTTSSDPVVDPDGTAPPSEPRLRPPAHRVSKRAIRYWTILTPLKWIPVIAAQVVWWIFDDGNAYWRWTFAIITAVFLVAHTVIEPRWRFLVHRWETTATAVYTQSGWFTQERRIAPLSRVQTVDLERGPIQQLFKLATVTVTTASAAGPLEIAGLDLPIAEKIVRDLTAAAEAAQGDAT